MPKNWGQENILFHCRFHYTLYLTTYLPKTNKKSFNKKCIFTCKIEILRQSARIEPVLSHFSSISFEFSILEKFSLTSELESLRQAES